MVTIRMVIPAVLIILLSGFQAAAWTGAAPNEVIFFDEAGFHGPSLTIRLEPGMRQALRPALGDLNDKISSIIVGEKVKALVFTEPAFQGAVRLYNYTVDDDMPDNDDISSIIVCLKEAPPQGVLFIQKRTAEVKTSAQRPWHYITGRGIFFPLPESAEEQEALFPSVPSEWGRIRYVSVAPGIQTKLYRQPNLKGKSLSLPCADCGPQTVFDLQAFRFFDPDKSSGVISSLSVRAPEKK